MDKNSDTHKQALQLITKGFLLIRFFAGREEHYPLIWKIADALHQIPKIIAQQPDKLPEEIEHIEQIFHNELSMLEKQKGESNER